MMSSPKKSKSKMNPEEKLQARVGIEIQRRLLDEHAKSQADALAVAKWESTMGQRDSLAAKRRDGEKLKDAMVLTETRILNTRESRIIDLYKEDENQYREELLQKGLAYRKQLL
jgi:DUF2075 family protein